jgi:OHCU decarboxylase
VPSNLPPSLERLNSRPSSEAEEEFLKCCGSREWAQRMVDDRPFVSFDDLLAKADRVWWSLESTDWLEAFHTHPKIGEKKAARQVSAEARAWSEQEQLGTRESKQETMNALADLNRQYEEKFGCIFIVCATGKSSEEMLAILRDRLKNKPDEELRIAASEQAKITQLRLKKLIETLPS